MSNINISCKNERNYFKRKYSLVRLIESLESLVAKKIKEISPSYIDTPEYKRAIEIVKEAEEASEKVRKLAKEYHDITGGNWKEYVHKSETSIVWELSKGNLLTTCIGNIIRDYVEIKMNTVDFNPEHVLRELENIFKEELSHIK